jgi:phosphonate transport system substrate-binding protein
MSRRWLPITIYYLLITGVAACSLPTPAASPTATVSPTPTATDIPVVKPNLGEFGNPILLALPPAQVADGGAIANGQVLAELLNKQTGYLVVAVAPTSYTDLIDAMQVGNAHIAALPPMPLVAAYEKNAVHAAFASTKQNVATLGAQFLARADRFTPYYDPFAGKNFREAPEALAQFKDKKPCWTETDSLAGYLVPAGILGWYKIPTQEAAFVQSHFSVVRAVYTGEVCDFGATYIDARTYPALKDEHPKLMDEIVVIWQVPPVIPYDGLFFSPTVPEEVSAKLKAALQQIILTNEGKAALTALYGIESMIPVDDNFYTEFVRDITSSGADWNSQVH